MKQIARLVVTDGKGRFLSVLQGNRKRRVAFPGGHVERNELPHEAAIRELREETGLDVLSLRMLCQIVEPKRHSFVFEAVATGTPHGSEEGSVFWSTPDAFLNGAYGDFARKVFSCWIQSNLPDQS